MTSRSWIAALALAGGAALLAATPAAADRLITMKSHTDAMEMMGQKTPAQDENYLYWFGDDAIRHDTGKVSTILRFDRKKMIWINHDDKTYSAIDLPIDFKKLVPPEMAPMMEQMATMMGGSAKVTPTDKSGSFGGFDCKFYRVDVNMSMMNMGMDMCLSDQMPVDYTRYQSMVESQAGAAAEHAVDEGSRQAAGLPGAHRFRHHGDGQDLQELAGAGLVRGEGGARRHLRAAGRVPGEALRPDGRRRGEAPLTASFRSSGRRAR